MSDVTRDAVLSPSGVHRYKLARDWNVDLPRCTFIMCNPSTADHEKDDPTIRKCIGFAKRLGFGGFDVVNLFSFRSADVQALGSVSDPIGGQNDLHVVECAKSSQRVFAAWGRAKKIPRIHAGRDITMCALLDFWGIELWCIGQTQDGDPRHPLMTPYDTTPTRFRHARFRDLTTRIKETVRVGLKAQREAFGSDDGVESIFERLQNTVLTTRNSTKVDAAFATAKAEVQEIIRGLSPDPESDLDELDGVWG